MPIINPSVNTNIETPIPEQGGLKGFLAGLENASREHIAEQNSAAKMAAAAAGLKRGDDKETAQEHAKLGSEFDKIAKKYEPVVSRVEIGTRALDRGDALGVNQAIVSLAGTTEGASQRILQSVIQKFGGSPTIMGSADKVASFLDGVQRTGKSAEFTNSLKSALQDIHADASKNYAKDVASFKAKAPGLAPLSSSHPGFQDELDNYSGGLNSRIADLDKSFSAKALPPSAPAPEEGIVAKAGNALGGLFNFLKGSQPATAMAATPPDAMGGSPAAPMSGPGLPPGSMAQGQPMPNQAPQMASPAAPSMAAALGGQPMAAPAPVSAIPSFEEWKKAKAAKKEDSKALELDTKEEE